MLTAENWLTVATLSVLAVTVTCFIWGKFRSDMVALGAILTLTLCGVLTPEEACSGFSNTIIPTIAGVFVLGGAIVRSGLAGTIGAKLMQVGGTNQNVLFMLLMGLTALVGSLVSNTGTVAIMMPIVGSVALSLDESPSRFLMPLAFMSGIGGMFTLIGNPANMVVNDVYVRAGYPSLTLFSFAPVGVVCIIFGMLVLAPATSWYLSRRRNEKGGLANRGLSLKELVEKYTLTQNLYKVSVPHHSALPGKSLEDLNLTGNFGVLVQEIRRVKMRSVRFSHARFEQISPGPQHTIEAGDILYCIGNADGVQSLVAQYGLERLSSRGADDAKDKYSFENIGVCELVLMSSSSLVDHSVAESALRKRFDITLLGIHRGDQYILENLKEQTLQAGDSLLVQGTWDHLAKLDGNAEHWVVVGRPEEQSGGSKAQRTMPFVAIVLLLMILSMATGFLPTVVAVLLAALAVLAGGCYRNVSEAYSSINWETLVMIACMLPMAIAMEKTGLVATAARDIVEIGRSYGPLAALALVYAVSSGMNIVISGTPVAVLVAPVAIQVALSLAVDPLPFLFAVAAASCLCFASPFATPANALVMSAGRYTFLDYLKIGLPLQLLMGVVLVLALPWLFPF